MCNDIIVIKQHFMGKDGTLFLFAVAVSMAVAFVLSPDLSFWTDLLFSVGKPASVYFAGAAVQIIFPQLRSAGLLYVRGRRVVWLVMLIVEALR